MFLDRGKTKRNGKVYTRYLLRESFRDETGKTRHRTVANISKCSPDEIDAIDLALKHKKNLSHLVVISRDVRHEQGPSVGATWLLKVLARRLGLEAALGRTRQGKLALWQVIARAIDQGSRLSAVRMANEYSACDVLELDGFNEDDLYENLDWLSGRQSRIEDRLFRHRYEKGKPELFLYDVTSSYLEGQCNAFGAYGYNRDGKKGKKQIVIGMLCDAKGVPLSVEVFSGNTQDMKTFGPQVKKVATRFGCERVTFVGDRGMIKSAQIEQLGEEDFGYITAITKPQIGSLLKQGVFQMSLFDKDLSEVQMDTGERYVLRRNPDRADEMRQSREDKYASLCRKIAQCNRYLSEHPRAQPAVAMRKMKDDATKRRIIQWTRLEIKGREIQLEKDFSVLAEESKLDGCYVIKTDLPAKAATKETIHDRYKDLALVEKSFRTCKMGHLEVRPVYVHLAKRTRGHVFVVMMSYLLIQALDRHWCQMDLTVEEGLGLLSQICSEKMRVKGKVVLRMIPAPRRACQALLDAADITLPVAIRNRDVNVATKKKLPSRRLR